MNRSAMTSTALALAALAAGWCLLDRWGLRDELPAGQGRLLYRAQVVASRPDAVLLRPLAGPGRDRLVEASPGGLGTTGQARLLGKAVFVEFTPAGRPVVRGIARDRLLLALAAGLVGLVVLVSAGAAWRFVAVLAAGAVTLAFLLRPGLAAGLPPLVSALAAGLVFLAIGAALIGRVGKLSVAILAGSIGGLAVAAVLALLAVRLGRLTGVYSKLTEDLWRNLATRQFDFRQLLAAGMVVGTCGIILDLASALASAVGQVARANPGLTRRQLAAAGMTVGRDVMGTELNTLIFAYAGAHLGVLLLPMLSPAVQGHEIPALRVPSRQDVAVEAFQMVAGTVALVLTIPITAAVSGALVVRRASSSAGTVTVRPARPGGRRWVLAAIGLLGVWWLAWACCQRAYHQYAARPAWSPSLVRRLVQARVLSTEPDPAAFKAPLRAEVVQRAECVLTSGPGRDRRVRLASSVCGFPGADKVVAAGDLVLLETRADGLGQRAFLIDFSRGPWLIHFGFVLAAVVLVVGAGRGLRALAALGVSAPALVGAMAGVALAGWDGAGTFLLVSAPLCGGVFVILAGPTRKALAATLATFGGLLVGGLCAGAATSALGLTGLASDAMVALRNFTRSSCIDYVGLLRAGMSLGLLGAAMDVAIAVASAAEAVQRAKPDAARAELFTRGLAVGRSVMVPMVLVLLFAYVGLNLPLLPLPQLLPGQSLSVLVSNERIAVELLRILVGGIGVVATVPVAAVAAALVRVGATENSHATRGGDRGAAGLCRTVGCEAGQVGDGRSRRVGQAAALRLAVRDGTGDGPAGERARCGKLQPAGYGKVVGRCGAGSACHAGPGSLAR